MHTRQQELLVQSCPKCESSNALEIVYGFASAEMFDSAFAGQIALGGCTYNAESAAFRCRVNDCGAEWGRWGDLED